VTPPAQVAEHADQVAAHRAADAAVVEFDDLFVRVLQQQLVVDPLLPELVLDHGDAVAVVLAQDPVEQGRLAAAEEAGEDGHRDDLGWAAHLETRRSIESTMIDEDARPGFKPSSAPGPGMGRVVDGGQSLE